MTIDDIRKYIVKLNRGSGCIVQPEDDEHSYILTARHVIDTANGDLWTLGSINQLVRFELVNDIWKEIVISIHDLSVGNNYFPHPQGKDIAILKVAKIHGLANIVRKENFLEDRDDYFLSGYPGSRELKAADPKLHRNNSKVQILDIGNKGMREAIIPGNLPQEEIEGQSGGAILKFDQQNILLAGILRRMAPDTAQQGAVEFYPVSNFDEIISEYRNVLRPILSAGVGSKVKREIVHVSIDGLSDDIEFKNELIELLQSCSGRIVIDSNNKSWAIINECNEEFFRIWGIESVNIETRKKFMTRIGQTLFKMLYKRHPQFKALFDGKLKNMAIELTFARDNVNYSSIPWEYLYYPSGIKEDDFAYPLANKILIVRRINDARNSEKEIDGVIQPTLKQINVLYVTAKNFSLSKAGEETDIRKAVDDLQEYLNRPIKQNTNVALSISFTFKSLTTISHDDFKTIINRTNPNIIHIVADINEPEELNFKLIEIINRAVGQRDHEKRLFLIIHQSPLEHKKSQYQGFDSIATYLLKRSNLSSFVSIPYSLGDDDAEFFSIRSFYENLLNGHDIGESFFSLSQEILSKESIALPILYLKDDYFAFSHKVTDDRKRSERADQG